MPWAPLIQPYLEPFIFLTRLHRFIKRLCPPTRSYLSRRELERAGIYTASHFVDAARQGRMNELKLFVQAEMSNNAEDVSGERPLIAAAAAGHLSAVRLLLDQPGIDADASNRQGDTALIVAARGCRVEVARVLLARGVDMNQRNREGENAWVAAIRSRCRDIEREVEARGADRYGVDMWSKRRELEDRGAFVATVFVDHCQMGKLSDVDDFLTAGIDVNARGTGGNTGLIVAAEAGHEEIVGRLMAQRKIDVNAANEELDTALIVAAREQREEIVRLLLGRNDINVNARSRTKESALLEAARRDYASIVDMLRARGAREANLVTRVAQWKIAKSPHEFSEKQFLSLARQGRRDWVELFLAAGIDVKARDERGNSGLILAARNNHAGVVKALLDHHATDVGACADDGTTALMAAAGREHREVMLLLLDAGADKRDLEKAHRWRLENQGHRFDANAFVRMAAKGQEALVSLYLDAGMAVDAADKDGNTALILAAREGMKKVVRILLERGADANLRNPNGNTALDIAVRKGHEQIAGLLRQHGAAASDASSVGLLRAIEEGDVDGARKALESGASPDQRNEFGEPALFLAVRLNREEIAALLLERGAKADERDAAGKTPLMIAAELGRIALAEILLERGALVDATAPDGATALILASWKGQTEMVKLLAEKGADVDRADAVARTPLTAALVTDDQEVVRVLEELGAEQGSEQALLLASAEGGDLARVRALLERGACLTTRDERGNTALMRAARRGRAKTVEALVKSAGDLDLINCDGDTALMLAAAAGWGPVVEVLLDAGARIDLCNSRGWSALLQAAAAGKGKVVELLARRGADPSIGAEGTTPLVEVCRYGPVSAVRALIDAGADVDQQAGFGASALMTASLSGQVAIVELLQANHARAGWEEACLFRFVRMGDEQGLRELDLQELNLEARDERGRTVLLEAADRGQAAIVNLLCSAGASPDVRSLDGDTALKLAAASGSGPAVAQLVKIAERDQKEDTAALLAAAERGHATIVRLLAEQTSALINGLGAARVPLIVAAGRGHYDVVQTLLSLGVIKDKRAANGQTALMAARLHGRQEIVDLLQRSGASVVDGDVELLLAAASGDLETVRRLLAPHGGSNPDARDELGRTALMRACEKRRLGVVTLLLTHAGSVQKRRVMVSATDLYGRTPLMWAAIGGELRIVQLLVDNRAIVDARSTRGRSALIEACHHGWLEVVEGLLAAMQDDNVRRSAVNAEDNAGNTPLGEASLMTYLQRQQDYRRIVDLLQKHGAHLGREECEILNAARQCDLERLRTLVDRVEVDGPRHMGMTALMLAVEADCADGAQILIDAGAGVNLRGPVGATPLILAAQRGKLDSLRLLLKENADCDLRDMRGETALVAAVAGGFGSVVEALIAAGANVNLPDRQGRTPLMQAVLAGRPDLANHLLGAGASNDREDYFGRTALTLAHLCGRRTGLSEASPDVSWQELPGLNALEQLLLASGSRRGWNEAELLLAARDDDAGEVTRLAEEGAVVHAPDLDGNSALLWACRHGNETLAETLLGAGANPDVSNVDGRTPLMEAIDKGNSDLARKLLRPGLDLDARDKDGDSALLLAARKGNSTLVVELVAAGADVNLSNHKRRTPLLESAANADCIAVGTLLERRANACARGANHRTAVMEAAERGNESMLRILLAHARSRLAHGNLSAYLNAVARVGGRACTAHDMAEWGGHTACAQLVAQYGGRPVRLTGYTVYLTQTGDFYHRYECGSCAQGRKHGTLEEIEIDSPRLQHYPPCDKCNPSYREAEFDWSCQG